MVPPLPFPSQAALADPALKQKSVPGLEPSEDGLPARGGMQLELRKLRLMEYQATLRAAVGAWGDGGRGGEMKRGWGL